MWVSAEICAHTVAVADTFNLLPSFVEKRKKLSDTPKGAGKKGGKPSKKYGHSAGRVTIKNYSSPFDESPPASTPTPFDNSAFFLKWVTRRISVCQGKCNRPIRDEEGRSYQPPYDLCLHERNDDHTGAQ